MAYSAPFIVAAVMMVLLAAMAWRRRHATGAHTLILLCAAAALWTAGEGLVYLGFSLAVDMAIARAEYLGIATVPPLTLLFVLTVFDFPRAWVRRCRILLSTAAAIVILIVWTDAWHHLIYPHAHLIDTGDLSLLALEHGTLWVVIVVYHYLLIAASTLILALQVVKTVGSHRPKAAIILGAVLVVWVANAVYVTGHSPMGGMDFSPLAFALVAAAMAWGFFRHSLLDVRPLAREAAFKGFADAVVVADGSGRVADLNAAARDLFRVAASRPLRMTTEALCAVFPGLHRQLDNGLSAAEASLEIDGRVHTYDVGCTPLHDGTGAAVGRLITFHDITERKRIEEALARRNAELTRLTAQLQQTLSEVKELSGLLPICAHCKKIRDDDGYWNQLEVYLSRHSKADFSHGICPDCLRKLYPEIADAIALKQSEP